MKVAFLGLAMLLALAGTTVALDASYDGEDLCVEEQCHPVGSVPPAGTGQEIGAGLDGSCHWESSNPLNVCGTQLPPE